MTMWKKWGIVFFNYIFVFRPMLTETRCCKVFFLNYSKKKSAEDTLVPPLWEKGGKYLFSKYYLFTQLHAAELELSRWKLSSSRSKTAHAMVDLRSRHRINPRPARFVSGKAGECRWRPWRYQVDPLSRRREVARGVLRPSSKPKKRSVLAIGEGPIFFVVCFLHISVQMC